jgi:anti-anti-sigma factor
VDAYLTGSSGDGIMITVRGEVDLSNTEGLLQRLIVLAHPATGHIALDLSQVTFMDCAGLRMLIMIDQHARARGGTVRVAAASAAVARLFELVGPLAAPVFAPPTPSGRHHPRRGIRLRRPGDARRPRSPRTCRAGCPLQRFVASLATSTFAQGCLRFLVQGRCDGRGGHEGPAIGNVR